MGNAPSNNQGSISRQVYWILRIALAGCFIGHGAYGILKKPAWLVYYTALHISPEWADKLFPVIGTMDILLAISVLIYPCRAALLWMTFWAVFTSLLRPLAGEGYWEFLERAGNYGVPIALLIGNGLYVSSNKKDFEKIKNWKFDPQTANRLILILKYTIGLLLIGHGGFGALMHKEMLIKHFASIGIQINHSALAVIGWYEILLGLLVIIKPARGILIWVLCWKIGTELLYPISGSLIWEFIERAGDYGAPLALFFLMDPKLFPSKSSF